VSTAVPVVADVLERWRLGIEARRPDEIAALFTEDAVFQGLRPYVVGRRGISEYYAGQPVGLAAHPRILETRDVTPGAVLGYAAVDFTFSDRPTVAVLLGILLVQVGDRWLIAHYQVSPALVG